MAIGSAFTFRLSVMNDKVIWTISPFYALRICQGKTCFLSRTEDVRNN